jgi:putative ABC transport system substrate-binding protein
MLLALSFPVQAQQTGKVSRIGVLGAPEEPRFSEVVGGLKQGLRDLGYPEQAIEILEVRVARRDRDTIGAMVKELVGQRVEVLFLIGSRLVKPARQSAPELPLVFLTPGDPVAAGFVSSLSRPGGNMTAMTFEYPELSGKRLELLKEMVPRVRRVLAFYDPRDASPTQGLVAAREAAPKLGITIVDREVRSREEITRGLESLGLVDAFLGIPGGFPTGHYGEIIRAANARRLPTIFHARTGSTAEALASYGASDAEIARQAARLIDKILKGAKAGELPVERPTKLELVINLKTAKQIGLTIPPNVLARADKVIR